MIQDALSDVILFPEATPTSQDYIFTLRNHRVALMPWDASCKVCEPLLKTADYTFFLGNAPDSELHPTQWIRTLEPMSLRAAAFTALHLAHWRLANRFCGACGAPLVHETGASLHCPQCGRVHFPKISPAVIVGLIHQGKLLVTHYADRPYKGLALVAGYCEIGETLEDTVRREVEEEVGLRCHNLRYFASQPWGLSGSLLVGFFADVDDPKVTLADGELADAIWKAPSELPQMPPEGAMSLTATMIDSFVKGGAI